MLHDVAVSIYWPGVEPVGPGQVRDRGLLQSAAARPFQDVFGVKVHDTIAKKSAALFHSLIANHPFQNGNKRTAVVSLYYFLLANGLFPSLTPDAMYDLAKATATYKERGLKDEQILSEIVEFVEGFAIAFEELELNPEGRDIFEGLVESRRGIRDHHLNRVQPPR